MNDVLLDSSKLELELFRKSADALRAGAERCQDCGRTLLVGEWIYHYASGRHACELCRSVRREQPQRFELVRSGEQGHTVRVLAGSRAVS